MKNRILTDALREVRRTRGRFLSLFLLSALAVAFLAGLRSTAPDMESAADRYFDACQLMDLRVLSTLGLTDEDLAWLSHEDGVSYVEGAYSVDAIIHGAERELVVKVHSLTEGINRPRLRSGRLPAGPGECAVEPALLDALGLELGDAIVLDTGDGDYADALDSAPRTIVGVVDSPLYISQERGTSTLGTGKAEALRGWLDKVLAPAAKDPAAVLAGITTPQLADRSYAALFGPLDQALEQVRPDLPPAQQSQADRLRSALPADGDALWAGLTGEQSAAYAAGLSQALTGGYALLDPVADETLDALADARTQLETGKAQLAATRAQLDAGQAELDAGRAELAEAQALVSSGTAELEARQAQLRSDGRSWTPGGRNITTVPPPLPTPRPRQTAPWRSWRRGRSGWTESGTPSPPPGRPWPAPKRPWRRAGRTTTPVWLSSSRGATPWRRPTMRPRRPSARPGRSWRRGRPTIRTASRTTGTGRPRPMTPSPTPDGS